MVGAIKPLVAGNWKMNGTKDSADEFAEMTKGYRADLRACADAMICPPATLLMFLVQAASGSGIAIGAQDCHAAASGAHTGDISAEMIADIGATAIIVGHSERRADHGETDADVLAKAEAAARAGLTAIVCVGETEAERRSGNTLDVVGGQIDGSLPDTVPASGLVVAYEPVWAIGTGLTPTPDDVAEVHAFIRGKLVDRYNEIGNGIRILYGGSVKPANAAELMAVDNVNGALVGGASLKADDFLGILAAYGN